MNDIKANIQLTYAATKQMSTLKPMQNKERSDDLSKLSKEKGAVTTEKVVDMANPTIDAYVTAMAEQDEVSKNKKKYSPTIEGLKERLEKALSDKYDNAHNMLAEAFYGFQVGTCSTMAGLLGADPAEMEAIRRKANREAKDKLQAGYERLASAYAEFEIYAS
jgi:hypothetical protein